jgi:hypothetical protein
MVAHAQPFVGFLGVVLWVLSTTANGLEALLTSFYMAIQHQAIRLDGRVMPGILLVASSCIHSTSMLVPAQIDSVLEAQPLA